MHVHKDYPVVKNFVAYWTNVWFVSSVYCFMFFKTMSPLKFFATEIATEWFSPMWVFSCNKRLEHWWNILLQSKQIYAFSVGSCMIFQKRPMCKPLQQKFKVCFFSSMGSCMVDNISLTSTCFWHKLQLHGFHPA